MSACKGGRKAGRNGSDREDEVSPVRTTPSRLSKRRTDLWIVSQQLPKQMPASSSSRRITSSFSPSSTRIRRLAARCSTGRSTHFSAVRLHVTVPLQTTPDQPHHTEHVRPLLSSLSPLHNFSIESQVQYFAPLAVNLNEGEDAVGTHVEEEDLRAFVNNAEWNLGASCLAANPPSHPY